MTNDRPASERAPVLIRPAMVSDVHDVRAIDRAVLGDASRDRFLAHAVAAGHCLIATLDNRPVGFAVLDRSFFGHAFLALLVVHPDHRRRRVATALVRHIEAICPSEKLFTSTNTSNIEMQRLCEGLGFVRSGWIENLDEGDPEIIYFKRLALPVAP